MKRLFSKVEWQQAKGASSKPKRLKLTPDHEGTYLCPVKTCEHEGFMSQRGCKKHVYTRHGWFYFFDSKPELTDAFPALSTQRPSYQLPRRSATKQMPAFSKESKIASNFKDWLCSSGGSSKSVAQANQIVTKLLKFSKFCCHDIPDGGEVPGAIIEYCVNSVKHIEDFIGYLQNDWKVGNPGVIGYLNALAHFLDYQRSKGLCSDKISQMMAAEVFINRAKRSFRKKMRAQWNTTLSIETLEKLNCWATLADLQNVVPFHRNRYLQIVTNAKSGGEVSSHDLSFSTSFIITILFLMVKGSRPMTYQYLTMDMMNIAFQSNIIDQTQFKTKDKYGFDTLIFSDEVLQLIKDYTDFLRPLLKPKSNYLLVGRTGNQLTKLSDVFGRLVYQAVGKYIHPTRYRQIVETESAAKLTQEEQQIISNDQKHTSQVAKVHYQKRKSREIALSAQASLQKLLQSTSDGDPVDLSIEQGNSSQYTRASAEDREIVISNAKQFTAATETTSRKKKVPFSLIEDQYLSDGIRKYGRGKWTNILNDVNFKFHSSRKPSTLSIRAKTKGFI